MARSGKHTPCLAVNMSDICTRSACIMVTYNTPTLSPVQAGGANEAKEVRTPAGLPRLFKSALDWNLYSSLQQTANDRSVRAEYP